MTERMISVPASVAEAAARHLDREGYHGTATMLRDALLEQPTAEPCCDRPGDPNWHTIDGGHVVPPDVEEDTPVAQPSIADMPPGTTFRARHIPSVGLDERDLLWFVQSPVEGAHGTLVMSESGTWLHTTIDPSTIRDVIPPKEHA